MENKFQTSDVQQNYSQQISETKTSPTLTETIKYLNSATAPAINPLKFEDLKHIT